MLPPDCKKKRVGKACDSCRLKKTKCNGKSPCQRCSIDNKICVYTQKKKFKDRLYSGDYVDLLDKRLTLLNKSLINLCKLVKSDDKEILNNFIDSLNWNENTSNIIDSNDNNDDNEDIHEDVNDPSITDQPPFSINNAIKFLLNDDLYLNKDLNFSNNSNTLLLPPVLPSEGIPIMLSSPESTSPLNSNPNSSLNLNLNKFIPNDSRNIKKSHSENDKDNDISSMGFNSIHLQNNMNNMNNINHNHNMNQNFNYQHNNSIITPNYSPISNYNESLNSPLYLSPTLSPSSITSDSSTMLFTNAFHSPINNNNLLLTEDYLI